MRGKIVKDPELTAMSDIQAILEGLPHDTQRRVIEYSYRRVIDRGYPSYATVTDVDYDTRQMTLDDVQPRELRCENEHGIQPPANS